MEEYPLTHPVYTQGGCNDAYDAIRKIKEIHQTYGENKYVNFVAMKTSELPIVQESFPNHIVTCTMTDWYYEVRPKNNIVRYDNN